MFYLVMIGSGTGAGLMEVGVGGTGGLIGLIVWSKIWVWLSGARHVEVRQPMYRISMRCN